MASSVSLDNSLDYRSYSFSNPSEAYSVLLGEVVRGARVSPRGMLTNEIRAAVNLRDGYKIPMAPGRKFNYFAMLAESLWVLSDLNDVGVISKFNSGLANYSDDGKTFYGAYGPRLRAAEFIGKGGFETTDQFDLAVKAIAADPDTRQAVLSIIAPSDPGTKTKDFPCNNLIYFKVRNGHLNMTVVNRSNDIHWGLFAVNIPQFAMMHRVMLNAVNAELREAEKPVIQLGTQTHVMDSLHTYWDDEHEKITARMSGNLQVGDVWGFPEIYPKVDSLGYSPNFDEAEKYSELLTRASLPEKTHIPVWLTQDAFALTAYNLLKFYADVKRGAPRSPEKFFNILYDSIRDGVEEEDFSVEDVPWHWIVACAGTLVQQGSERRSNTTALHAGHWFFHMVNRLRSDSTIPNDKLPELPNSAQLVDFFRNG